MTRHWLHMPKQPNGTPGEKPPAVGHFLSPQREMYQSAADSSDCRLRGDRDLSRTGCCAFWTSSARHRSTSLNQNALSLALRATEARRRHSSARRRKCSTLTCFLPADRLSCPIVSSRNVIEFFVSRLPKLFARLRSIEPRAPFPTLTRCLPHPLRSSPGKATMDLARR